LPLCLGTLVPIIEDDIIDAGIGKCRAIVEDGNCGNRDHLFHARRREGDLGCLVQRVDRASERRAVGQLHGDHRVALVLIGNEGRRQAGNPPNPQSGDNKPDEDDEASAFDEGADQPSIGSKRL
jgi:hypothetical protein